jgi:preprotein translocase SecE subunit
MTSKQEQLGKKWIQASVAITCFILTYILIQFFTQMGEWFELERFLPNYYGLTQAVSVLLSIGVFVYIIKNAKTSTYLKEVFNEAVKVIWPNREETNKHTVAIIIGVTIVGFILGLFDFVAGYLLSLLN